MGLKAPSKLGTNPSRFTRLPNKFTRSSKITQTVPLSSETIANIRVVFGVTADHTATFRRSANVGVAITASATGLNTGGLELGTAVVSVGITSTASANVTRSGVASVSVGVTSTCTGALATQTYYGTASVDVGITATATGASVAGGTTHTGTADCQVNIDIVATGRTEIEFDSIVAWWDAKVGRTVDSSTPPRLTSWADRAGSSQQTLTRWNAGGTDRAPEYSATGGALNGPVIDFNGTSHSMYVVDDTILSDTKASIFFLVKMDSNKSQFLFTNRFGSDSSVNDGITIHQDSSDKLNMTDDGSTTATRKTDSAVDLTSWTLLEVYYDSGWELKINGTTQTLTGSPSGRANLPEPISDGDANLFASGNYGSSGFVGGLISDAVFYNEKLSTSNQLIVRNYLKKKQGLDIVYGTGAINASITASATGTSVAGSTTHTGTASISASITASATGASVAGAWSNDYSLRLDGTNDYIDGNNFNANTIIGTGDMTVSMWVKLDTTTQYDTFMYVGASGSSAEYLQLRLLDVGGSLKVDVRARVGSSGNAQCTGTTTVTTGTWYNVVLTRTGTTCKIYLNGSLDQTATDSNFGADFGSSTDTATWIGAYLGGYSHMDGLIDEISIWDDVLSSAELTAIYNSGAPIDLASDSGNYASSSNLVGYWRFEENSGTSIADSSTNSNTATLTNGPTFSTDVPVWSNDYSISCDGTDDYIDLNSNFASVFNSDFSVAFWINLPEGQPTGSGHSVSSNSNIFGISNSDNAHRFFGLIGRGGQSDAGKLRIYYKANGNQVQARSASAFFSSGATGWVHVVITLEEGSDGIKMYKNGSAVSVDEADSSMSTVTMSNFAGNVDMVFGASNRGGTPNYEVDADFDEISIFNTALSSSQVSNIYNSGTPTDLSSDSNLVGYWRFEENTGTSIADSSTNSNTATLTNGPTFSTDVPIAWSNDYSLSVDGTNDHLATNFITNTHSLKDGFSSSLWVYLDDNSTTQDFFGRYGDGSARFYFGITGTKVRAAVGNAYDTTTLSHGMSTGAWYHVAYTFSGGSSGTFTYYLNGSSVGTISFTWTSDSGSYEPVHIGGLKNGANTSQNPTNGKLDEIAFYNSALSASDITAIYNSGAPTDLSSDTDLVAYWRMEENTGSTVADSSSNSYTATLTNGPTFSTDTP